MTPWTPHPLAVHMYRSRYPTLRTVRIGGSGEVWVDGTRRACSVSDKHITVYASATEHAPVKLAMLCSMADAMEVVR